MTTTSTEFGLDVAKLPQHVGIVMDGNGRWATQKHLPRIAGHRKGVDRVREIVEFSAKLGLNSLTLFAFSDENWRRPEEEVSALMGLLRFYIRAERQKLIENNIQFRMLGDRRKLSSDILDMVNSLERDTTYNSGLKLNIALSYGGRGEIIRTVKRIISKVKSGELFPDDIDESTVEDNLDTSGLPNVDLLIRTSGEKRISNFLLWQIAYAELFFEDTYWPDFTSNHFLDILKSFKNRERRFGKTSEQIRKDIKTISNQTSN